MCYIAFTNVRCSVQDVVPKSEVNRLRIYDARHSPANRRIERGEEEEDSEEEALARSPALYAELIPSLKLCNKAQIFLPIDILWPSY